MTNQTEAKMKLSIIKNNDIETMINTLVQREIYTTTSGTKDDDGDFNFTAQEILDREHADGTMVIVTIQVEQKVIIGPENSRAEVEMEVTSKNPSVEQS